MAALLLTSSLSDTFLGALLSICRADGEVNMEEIAALELAVADLFGAVRYDKESLLFSQVTPRSFAEALCRDPDGPFRAAGTSDSATIAQEFVRSALRVARADGDVNESELRQICAFAQALGAPSSILRDLDAKLDEWLAHAEN